MSSYYEYADTGYATDGEYSANNMTLVSQDAASTSATGETQEAANVHDTTSKTLKAAFDCLEDLLFTVQKHKRIKGLNPLQNVYQVVTKKPLTYISKPWYKDIHQHQEEVTHKPFDGPAGCDIVFEDTRSCLTAKITPPEKSWRIKWEERIPSGDAQILLETILKDEDDKEYSEQENFVEAWSESWISHTLRATLIIEDNKTSITPQLFKGLYQL